MDGINSLIQDGGRIVRSVYQNKVQEFSFCFLYLNVKTLYINIQHEKIFTKYE